MHSSKFRADGMYYSEYYKVVYKGKLSNYKWKRLTKYLFLGNLPG